jgi:hypothetical protein
MWQSTAQQEPYSVNTVFGYFLHQLYIECRQPTHAHNRLHTQGFWATDRERVFLVGVEIYGGQQAAAARAAAAAAAAAAPDRGSASRRTTPPRRAAVQYSVHESLEELGRLADTAGLKVCVCCVLFIIIFIVLRIYLKEGGRILTTCRWPHRMPCPIFSGAYRLIDSLGQIGVTQ